MRKIQNAIHKLKRMVDTSVDGVKGLTEWVRVRRPSPPSFTSVKWLSSRRIRQQYFTVQFEANLSLFDEAFANAIDQKREEAEKQFFKVALIQITLTGFMLLALMKATVAFNSRDQCVRSSIHKLFLCSEARCVDEVRCELP